MKTCQRFERKDVMTKMKFVKVAINQYGLYTNEPVNSAKQILKENDIMMKMISDKVKVNLNIILQYSFLM